MATVFEKVYMSGNHEGRTLAQSQVAVGLLSMSLLDGGVAVRGWGARSVIAICYHVVQPNGMSLPSSRGRVQG